MKNKKLNPILITGSHHSGTTWVGKMLALSNTVNYRHEPFVTRNKWKNPIKYDLNPVYKNIELIENPKIKDAIYNFLRKDLFFSFKSFGFDLLDNINNKKYNFKRKIRNFNTIIKYHKNKLQNKRPIMKDPLALFSAEWLHKEFNMDVVILIRHPAAFALSTAGTFDFNMLLSQPKLLNGFLAPYKNEIINYSKGNPDKIDKAILLWKIFYTTVKIYQQRYPEWYYIKHEDLSLNPEKEFKKLYEWLNIPFSPTIKKQIYHYTHAADNTRLKRDSKKNAYKWKNLLKQEDIDRIKEGLKEVSSHFYSEKEW